MQGGFRLDSEGVKDINDVVEMAESDADCLAGAGPRDKGGAAACKVVRTIGRDDEIRLKKAFSPEEFPDPV
jgi:hypothetical protein